MGRFLSLVVVAVVVVVYVLAWEIRIYVLQFNVSFVRTRSETTKYQESSG